MLPKKMSLKRGKGKEDDDFISDNAPPLKKKPSKKGEHSGGEQEDDDSIFICEVSNNRKVSVRNWNGKIFVDIREFYIKDGKQHPGKKGISLTMDQWKNLRAHVDEIDQALA